MATRFYSDIFVVLGTDLAQLEGGAHLAIELVLLLSHLDVILRRIKNQVRKIRVHVSTVRIEVANWNDAKRTV